MRECPHCPRKYTTDDLSREESTNMEAERKAARLEGVRFLYYHCSGCASDNIFVDILSMEGERVEEFESRRAAMESVVRTLHTDRVGAVVVPIRKE